MPSGICMEIHTEIVQNRKKKQSRDEGNPRPFWPPEPALRNQRQEAVEAESSMILGNPTSI